MIEWIRKIFSSAISFFFVLFIIIFAIPGAIIGYSLGQYTGCCIGLALGGVIGIILGVLCFGFMATILNMSETMEEISKKLSTNNIGEKTTNSNPNIIVCKKCGTENSKTNKQCKECGDYFYSYKYL